MQPIKLRFSKDAMCHEDSGSNRWRSARTHSALPNLPHEHGYHPTLQIWNIQHREAMSLAQEHTASKGHSPDLNPSILLHSPQS